MSLILASWASQCSSYRTQRILWRSLWNFNNLMTKELKAAELLKFLGQQVSSGRKPWLEGFHRCTNPVVWTLLEKNCRLGSFHNCLFLPLSYLWARPALCSDLRDSCHSFFHTHFLQLISCKSYFILMPLSLWISNNHWWNSNSYSFYQILTTEYTLIWHCVWKQWKCISKNLYNTAGIMVVSVRKFWDHLS